jgi:hypothetical protein
MVTDYKLLSEQMMKTLVKALSLSLLFLSMSSLALADGIDFAGGSGGSMSFTNALGQKLSVTDAPIDSIVLASRKDPKFTVSGGLLDFMTGAATNIQPTLTSFGAGSSSDDLSISGTVFNGATQVASGILLTGSFLSGTLQTGPVGVLGGIFNITSINPDLMLAVFGSIPPGPSTGSIGQVVFNMEYDGTSYSGTIGSTNLIASIPEPAGLLLLGSGLILGAGFMRRSLEKKQNRSTAGLLS